MNTRATKTTLALTALLLSTQAAARPDNVPTSSEKTLPGSRGGVPILRVIPNTALDVLFYNQDTDETWRWDVIADTAYALSADYVKGGQAHGHYAVTYRTGKFDVFDFRTNQFTHYSESSGGPMSIHGNWICKESEGANQGVLLLNLSTGAQTVLAETDWAGSCSISGDWVAFRHTSGPNWHSDQLSIVQLSTLLSFDFANPGPGTPHVGSGKIVVSSPEEVTWEYIGHPATRKRIRLESECRSTRQHRLGGTNSQFLAYVATDCPSGHHEVHVLNLHTERRFFVGHTASFHEALDMQSNVISFADPSAQLRLVVIDEASAR